MSGRAPCIASILKSRDPKNICKMHSTYDDDHTCISLETTKLMSEEDKKFVSKENTMIKMEKKEGELDSARS